MTMENEKTIPAGARVPLVKILGPGLITGASDDDPSGIATYSQAGAQFGYGLTWTLLFTYPLMAGIQEISARIGRVTGLGIAGNLRRNYPRPLLYSLVGLVLMANIFNLGADVGAMGAGVKLLIGGPAFLYVAAFGLGSVLLEIFMRYSRYVSVLKWLSLSLLAYAATAFILHVPWSTVALSRIALSPSLILVIDISLCSQPFVFDCIPETRRHLIVRNEAEAFSTALKS